MNEYNSRWSSSIIFRNIWICPFQRIWVYMLHFVREELPNFNLYHEPWLIWIESSLELRNSLQCSEVRVSIDLSWFILFSLIDFMTTFIYQELITSQAERIKMRLTIILLVPFYSVDPQKSSVYPKNKNIILYLFQLHLIWEAQRLFLHICTSSPVSTQKWQNWSDCGMNYEKFAIFS